MTKTNFSTKTMSKPTITTGGSGRSPQLEHAVHEITKQHGSFIERKYGPQERIRSIRVPTRLGSGGGSILANQMTGEIPAWGIEQMKAALRKRGVIQPDPNISRFSSKGIRGGGFFDAMNEDPDSQLKASLEGMMYDSGFLWPRLCADSFSVGNQRWKWWQDNYHRKNFSPAPIPFIEWLDAPEQCVLAMLENVLTQITPEWRTDCSQKWAAVNYLFDWLLWGLGHPYYPRMPESLWDDGVPDRIYQTFDWRGFLLWPYDYLHDFLYSLRDDIEQIPRPTPMAVVKGWVEQLFPHTGYDPKSAASVLGKLDMGDTVMEPEPGCGRLWMVASNYSADLRAMSTWPVGTKALLIQMYLYVPWGIYPFEFLQDKHREEIDKMGTGSRAAYLVHMKNLSPNFFDFNRVEVHPDFMQYLPVYQVRHGVPRDLEKSEGSSKPKGLPPSIQSSKPSPPIVNGGGGGVVVPRATGSPTVSRTVSPNRNSQVAPRVAGREVVVNRGGIGPAVSSSKPVEVQNIAGVGPSISRADDSVKSLPQADDSKPFEIPLDVKADQKEEA